mgnify:CR=1 FL=1
MITKEEENGIYDSYKPLNTQKQYEAMRYAIDKASRLERIKTLEEVRKVLLTKTNMIDLWKELDRLIEQAKSE